MINRFLITTFFVVFSGFGRPAWGPTRQMVDPFRATVVGKIGQHPDQLVKAQKKYLLYLHGRIIEEQGVRPRSEQYGVYEYEQILETFRGKGFVVISEARKQGTDVRQYAAKIVDEIRRLLGSGVLPGQITVVGASKGAVIAMLASTLLKNREINFVIMANCNEPTLRNFAIDLHGNVLSIYEMSDEVGNTCRQFFDQATGLNQRKEVALKTNLGHGFIYRPLKEWVDPVVEWAKQSGGTQ